MEWKNLSQRQKVSNNTCKTYIIYIYLYIFSVFPSFVYYYLVHQGSPTYGLRAKCGPFQKIMALFKSRGAEKKGHQKIWENWQKSTS